MPNRPILTLAQIDAFDPLGPSARKWCPLCGETKPKDAAHRCLSIERSSGLWRCFRCGASGQAQEFWPEKSHNLGRAAKMRVLRAAFALENPLEAPQTPFNEVLAVSGDHETPGPQNEVWRARWDATRPLDNTAGAGYLAGRSISLASALWAQVRWSDSWSGHSAVVFPICGRDGGIVAAQARAIRGDAKLTAGPKKNGAFFAPVALAGGRLCGPLDSAVPAIILVEAPIDALSLATCGFPALALCGTSGPAWLHLACGLRRVLLGFDADEAGDAASEKTATLLGSFGARCERLRPENAKDWNEFLQTQGAASLDAFLASQILV